MLRTLRNVVLSIVVLLLIFGAAGAIYVFVFSGNGPSANQAAATPKEQNYSIPKPKKPGPNAPVGVSVQSLMTPVKQGENSSISVRTLPGASCTITVTYNNVPSKDSGLIPKNADDYGNATWSWTVDKAAPVGKWPVKVLCTYNKKSGMVIGDLVVTN